MAESWKRISGDDFRKLRKSLGMTQAQVARMLQLESEKSIRNWEADRGVRGVPYSAYALLTAEYERLMHTVPLLGHIPAGPVAEIENEAVGSVEWERPNLNDVFFAMTVVGESVASSTVVGGDIVIIRANPEVRSGLVIAEVNGRATLKELRYENGWPVLIGDTDGVVPNEDDELRIIGEVFDRLKPSPAS